MNESGKVNDLVLRFRFAMADIVNQCNYIVNALHVRLTVYNIA